MAHEELKHIDPPELSDLLAGETSEAREGEIRRHLEACGVCQAELALAESFHEQANVAHLDPAIEARLEAGLAAAHSRTRAWLIISGRSPWVSAGLLAASLALVLLGFNTLREPSLRQGPSGAIRGVQPAAEWDFHLSETGSGRINIAWPAVDGAREYEIRLQSTAGKVLWSRRVVVSSDDITLATLPAAVRSESFLFVTVVARMADGTKQVTPPHPWPARP